MIKKYTQSALFVLISFPETFSATTAAVSFYLCSKNQFNMVKFAKRTKQINKKYANYHSKALDIFSKEPEDQLEAKKRVKTGIKSIIHGENTTPKGRLSCSVSAESRQLFTNMFAITFQTLGDKNCLIAAFHAALKKTKMFLSF